MSSMRELLKRVLMARTIGYPLPPSIVKEIEAELAKPEPVPLGEVDYFEYGNALHVTWTDYAYRFLKVGDKIYTHPPAQQKPLSVDEIMNFYNESAAKPKNAWRIKSVIIETARRVEQAHGIK